MDVCTVAVMVVNAIADDVTDAESPAIDALAAVSDTEKLMRATLAVIIGGLRVASEDASGGTAAESVVNAEAAAVVPVRMLIA